MIEPVSWNKSLVENPPPVGSLVTGARPHEAVPVFFPDSDDLCASLINEDWSADVYRLDTIGTVLGYTDLAVKFMCHVVFPKQQIKGWVDLAHLTSVSPQEPVGRPDDLDPED